jgi:capsular exopolysaccharide synthesis family protein
MINFSELLWKPGQAREPGRRTTSVLEPKEIEFVPALQHIATETAQLGPKSRVALLTDSRSAGADRFRFLRMRLLELRQLAKLRSMVITSPMPKDGKSTIAMSLATALAEKGKQAVLLIEADLHHPSLAISLGLRTRPGLAACLEEGLDPMPQIRRVEPLAWYLLQAGTPQGNPTELLQSDGFSAILQAISPHFDWVLIDTPPVLPLTDALSLSRQADATLLVARAGRTSREAIEEAIKLIERKHVLGIVLNGAENLTRRYSQYYGHYGKNGKK